VGIGTSSPTVILDCYKAAYPEVRVRSASYTNTFGVDTVGGFGVIGSVTNNPFVFTTNGTERMRINNSGQIRVNTTAGAFSTADRLAILNTAGETGIGIACDNTNGIGIGIYHGYTATGNATAMMFHNSGGSTVGTITMTASATSYNTSSDYRLKENITPVQGAGDIVKAMQPVTYTFKSDGSWHDGFLAHELQELHPRAVVGEKDAMKDEEYEVTPAVEATYDDEGVELTPAVPAVMGTRSVPDYQGVDYSKLTPILTAALQEALNKIEVLEAQNAAFEARLTALEAV